MIFRLLVWIVFLVGGALLGIYLDNKLFPGWWHNGYWHIIAFITGLLILKLVMTISRNTGRTLAKYGRRGDIPRLQTNVLVKQGVYSCMRHPMHLGLMLFPVSIAFLTGSLSFILFIAPAEIILMIIMIFTIEERGAIKKFGQEYLQYKREVHAFNFKWKCLRKLFVRVENREKV